MKKLILVLFPFISFAQSLTMVDSIKINNSQIWGVISYNNTIKITTMMPGSTTMNHIHLIEFDENLNQLNTPIQLTFDTDIPSGKTITDHKHLFINDQLFICYSLTQDEDLYVFKTDNLGNRIGNIETVVSGQADPTNDMIMFLGENNLIHILFFRPISQHHIYTYDLDLNLQQNQLTSLSLPHNNIGEGLYKDSYYYLFTGNEFGHNSDLILTKWNADWSPAISSPQSILASMNGDGNWFSTGLIYDTTHNLWIVAFQHVEQSIGIDSEHVDIAFFDDNFNEVYRINATNDYCFRPDLLLINDYLYLVYDKSGNGVFIKKYLMQNMSSLIQEKSTNKKLLKKLDILGRDAKGKNNEPLFYIYDDGTVEKRITIE